MTVPDLTAPRRPKKLTRSSARSTRGCTCSSCASPACRSPRYACGCRSCRGAPTHPARAALLSDSVLTGTAEYDRAGLAAAVQALGGDLGVNVDADRLVFAGNVLATNLRGLLGVLADVLTGATYPTAEVVAERERLVERLTIARSRAGVVAGEALAKRMWGDHPYARDLPEPDDVAKTTAAQLRRMHADMVRPDGAVLVVVGDVSPARTLDQVAAASASGPARRPRSGCLRCRDIAVGPLLRGRPSGFGAVVAAARYLGAAARRRALPGAATREPDLRWLLLLEMDREHPRGQGLHLRTAQRGRSQLARLVAAVAGRRRDRGDRARAAGDALRDGQDRFAAADAGRGRVGSPVRDRHAGAVDRDAGRARLDHRGARRGWASGRTGWSSILAGWPR